MEFSNTSVVSVLFLYLVGYIICTSSSETTISISGDDFYMNNKKTYSSASNSNVHGDENVCTRMWQRIVHKCQIKFNINISHDE